MEWRLLVLPREVSRTCGCDTIRNTDNSSREKSAEAIVDDRNELKKKRDTQRTHKSLKG